MVNCKSGVLILLACFVFLLVFVDAQSFSGYAKYNASAAANGTNVTFTVYEMTPGSGPSENASYSNLSNADGFFNISEIEISDNQFFTVTLRKYNSSNSLRVDYVGPTIPMFPGQEISQLENVSFYLKEGATINVTAHNGTGINGSRTFQYQLKDTLLGYPISEGFNSYVSNKLIYVPVERNYSFMIYPNESFPVSKDIFSGDLSDGYFTYSFNATERNGGVRLSGYVNSDGESNFTNLYLVSYLLEPGRMIYYGDYSMAIYNFTGTDEYNASSGFFNVSLVAPAENSSVILMPVAQYKDGNSEIYSAFKEVLLTYNSVYNSTGEQINTLNFTLYPLRGTETNISAFSAGNNVNVTIKKYPFYINQTQENGSVVAMQSSVHLEVDLDYGANMINFTLMTDLESNSGGNFFIPVLDTFGVKNINAFTMGGAPMKKKFSSTDLDNNDSTLVLKLSMDARSSDSEESFEDIFVDMITNSDECNVPNYAVGCSYFAGSLNKSEDSFNPFSIVVSGAPMSFVMRNNDNITVIYVNVDLLASGPPDAIFDDSADNTSSSNNFQEAWKFGSTGPSVYDYVIIGVPYTEGSTSITGFNESSDINMTVPILYGENFSAGPIWNSTRGDNITNITSSSSENELYEFYDYIGTQYESYLNGTNLVCNASDSNLSTGLCYKDTINNMVWFKIKHFSGVGPSPSGNIIVATAATATTTPSDSSTGGSSVNSFLVTDSSLENGYERILRANQKLNFSLDGEKHYLTVNSVKSAGVELTISSSPQTKTLVSGEVWKVDVDLDGKDYDLLVNVSSVITSFAKIKIQKINEIITTNTVIPVEKNDTITDNRTETNAVVDSRTSLWVWLVVLVLIVLVVVIVVIVIIRANNSKPKRYLVI
ncbi:MAG: hypothetical protein Q8N88_02945, partial [Nanoarchaeota archaeon]|nr:hypothetical protein [Nanoarchaeota archaeon]